MVGDASVFEFGAGAFIIDEDEEPVKLDTALSPVRLVFCSTGFTLF